MGGAKGDRKAYSASSAAKAAEALAARGGAGFGGFSGIQPVAGFGFGAPAAAAAAAAGAGGGSSADAAAPELSSQLDGDLAQCLRHLSKRDTTTKLKALQSLRELLPQKSAVELSLLLQPWAYQFKRLLLDPSKAVRVEAAGIMAAVGAAAGKSLLPQLKGLLGPWYLACFDPYPDAAAAAKRSLAHVFPGRKQTDALLYCRAEVLAHIAACLAATPASLGDPRKDTPEELEERHERITAASLSAAAALLGALAQAAADEQQQAQPGEGGAAGAGSAAAALEEVQGKLGELLAGPGFFKKALASKSLVVRRAGYSCVKGVATAAPQLLAGCLGAAAPAVLGTLQEKEASNHPAMWAALLAFIRATQPDCWASVNLQKAVVPRLLALLRHGCYGSAPSSLPALLPLLALLPRSALGLQQPLLLDSVLASIWSGQQHLQQQGLAGASMAASAATAAAYHECLSWGLRNAAALAAAGSGAAAADVAGGAAPAQQYCEALLLRGHFAELLQLALTGSGPEAQLAADIVRDVLLSQCGSGPAAAAASSVGGGEQQPGSGQLPVALQVLLSALGGAARQALGAACQAPPPGDDAAAAAALDSREAAAAGACSRLALLLDALQDSAAPHSAAAARELASSCCGVLLPLVQAGQQLPAPAANLLARLIREHPGAAAASPLAPAQGGEAAAGSGGSSSSSIASLVRLGVAACGAPGGAPGGAPAAADLELLLSCVDGSGDPAAAWGDLLSQVVRTRPASTAGLRFLDGLLREAVASSQSLAGDSWSHPLLDSLVGQLLQEVSQPQAAAASSSSSSSSSDHADDGSAQQPGGDSSAAWELSPRHAAAASLLACVLGANKQQAILLSAAALQAALTSMMECLQSAQQQHAAQHAGAAPCRPPDAAAPMCVAALAAALASTNHVSASGGSSSSSSSVAAGSTSSLWQAQPDALVQLLLLLAQLSWGLQDELDLDMLCMDDDSSSDDSASDSSEASTSDDSSAGSISSSQSASDAQLTAQPAAGGSDQGATAAAKAWSALQASAARVWGPDLLSLALAELPHAPGLALLRSLQQQLAAGLAAASAEAGAAAGPTGVAAAVEAGCRWGSRAAAVLEGLHERPEQQQQLLQELLTAAQGWQRWCSAEAGCCVPASRGSGGAADGCGSDAADASGSAPHLLMVQFAAVLVLQLGCDIVLPLHHGHLLPSSRTDADGASSSAAACTDGSRQWLLLELLCAATCCSMPSGSSTRLPEALLRCVPAAAQAAQRHLLRAAGKGSTRAASTVARSKLADALSSLLAAAAAAETQPSATAAAASHACRVYSGALVGLLQQVVAACAAPAAREHLLPVLQAFMRVQLAAAATAHTCSDPPPAGGAGSTAAAWLLVQLLELSAQACRFAESEDAVTAAGLDALSVGLMRRATALPAFAASASAAATADGVAAELQLLQLALACFPLRFEQPQQPHHHHAQQRHSSEQAWLRAGSSTAAERQGLTALLRHVCAASNSGSSAGAASSGPGAAARAAAEQLQCQLQLACVGYCWADMAAQEWHVVLRDTQQRLGAARREVERAAGGMAGAACSAAQALLGGRADIEAATPAAAIQLLRRLDARGLLQKQPAVTGPLHAAVVRAVSGLEQLPALQLGLQLLAAVLQLQEQVQAAGRAPQLGLALASAWRELLALLLGLGAAVAVAGGCGAASAQLLLDFCQARGGTWRLLRRCLLACCEPGGDAVAKALATADERAQHIGVDAVGACLALLQHGAQQPGTAAAACEPLQQLAWELLLHPVALAAMTHAAQAGGADEGDAVPEFGVDDDAAAFLVAVGLRPETAVALVAPRPWQGHLLHWALLLGHLAQLPPRSLAQRRLCQALRDVPELVPELLERLVGLIGLAGSSRGSRGAAAAAAAAAVDADTQPGGEAGSAAPGSAEAAPPGALSPAAQASLAASLQAAGTSGAPASPLSAPTSLAAGARPWTLPAALRAVGLPYGHAGWRLLAAACYRAVLALLPASARLWFSDLRDRSRAAAVEAYTSRHESPALLAAEFAAIRRDASGARGEVGGSCSFRVVASPGSREVTAVLEIEDGATLELVVKLPAAAPLRAPDVECKNKVGIKDGRLRKWLLSISVFLRNQNQGLLDGIGLWRANLEQEFAGVEACLICACVISATSQMPRLQCRQCGVRFHPACLYRWFRTSGKSNCPHCQSPWAP